MPETKAAPEVTTTQFLTAIFRGKDKQDRVYFNNSPTMSPADPRAGGNFWGGRHSDDVGVFGDHHAGNTYYCVSSVGPDEDGTVRRSESHFRALHVLVLDDIKSLSDLPTDPSYVLETSEGNYQVGFIFSQPVGHLPTARAFMRGMTRSGWLKGNVDASGNNPVRWVRAPGGRNWKTNPPFMHRMVVWLPELVFDPVELAAQLGIDLTPEADAPQPFERAATVGSSVPEGARNSTMTSLAGTMRRRGFGEDAIYEALRVENHARCSPPLPDQDIRTIARSIARYAPSESYLAEESSEPAEMPPIQIIPAAISEMMAAAPHPRVLIDGLLYADVRARYATGGTGKTTLALYEMIRASLSLNVWGKEPVKEIKSVFISREDSREMLLARMFRLCKAMNLTDEEISHVGDMVRIVDMTSAGGFRLSEIERDVVVPNKAALACLIDSLGAFNADWVVMDPLVSFGVGENRVNDAMQGLIEACRIVRNQLDIAVELIHHVSKAAASEGRTDQHAGRGGTALSDGCRMVVSMATLKADDWMKETGSQLDGRHGIKMELAKLSFAPQQKPVYIIRDGWDFQSVDASPQTSAERADSDAERLFSWLSVQSACGYEISQRTARDRAGEFNLNDRRFKSAWAVLLAEGSLANEGNTKGSRFVLRTDRRPQRGQDEQF